MKLLLTEPLYPVWLDYWRCRREEKMSNRTPITPQNSKREYKRKLLPDLQERVTRIKRKKATIEQKLKI